MGMTRRDLDFEELSADCAEGRRLRILLLRAAHQVPSRRRIADQSLGDQVVGGERQAHAAPEERRPRTGVDDGHAVLDGPGGKTISDAAIVAMSEHGYHGTSVRDIADRAG